MKKFYATITLAILCLSIVLSLSFTVNAQQAESWPMFHRDLSHTGYSTATGPSTNQTLWTFKTQNKVWSSPAVVDGVVYFGSFDKNVYAVKASDGAKIWNYSTGDFKIIVKFTVYGALAHNLIDTRKRPIFPV